MTDQIKMGAVFLLIITMVNSAIIRPHVVEAARGMPPRMHNVETKFRIPLGQKQFKLVCPIITVLEKDNTMIQWSKNGEQLDWDSQYKLSKDGKELKMKSVKFEDSGRYQCQATNGFGHKTMEFIVHVHDQNDKENSVKDYLVLSNTTASPSWLIDMNSEWRSPIKINTGGKLELRCPAQGNPLPEIRWYQNEMEISEKTHKHVSSIAVEPVDSSYSGVYRCVVENSLGSLSFAFDVTVGDFFDPPTTDISEHQETAMEPIIDQPYNISVYAGHTAQFQCKVKSNENTIIKWLKEVSDPAAIRHKDPNATVIHANGMNLLVLDYIQSESTIPTEDMDNVYTNRLTIHKVDYQHAGKYICVVTSAQGQIVYKSAELKVLSSYDFTFPFKSDGFLVVLAVVVSIFVFIVILAIIWLKKNQESTTRDQDLKPPPPPRMPPPAAPQENDWSSDRTMHSSKPLLLHNSMFKQPNPMKYHAATMDRNNLIRAERRFDEMSNVYDNNTVHPYWTQQRNNNSIYNGGYRTLEVQHHRNYPTSDEYTDQDMFYYK